MEIDRGNLHSLLVRMRVPSRFPADAKVIPAPHTMMFSVAP